jgi:hypothetical protein
MIGVAIGERPLLDAPLFNKATLAILLPSLFAAQPGQSTMPISKKQVSTTIDKQHHERYKANCGELSSMADLRRAAHKRTTVAH